MSGSLITLPWRLGARGATLAWRTAGGAVQLAGDLTGLVGVGLRHGPAREEDSGSAHSPARETADSPEATPPPTPPPAPTPSRLAAPGKSPAPPEPSSPAQPADPPALPEEFAPSHVSEEPELVAEVAEPGAEDGAGAQVTIAEPWDGYRLMNAGALIDRLPDLTPAELAAVELYELTNRRRQTLLTAVQRELKQRS